MAGILGPHVSTHSNTGRDHLKLLADLLPDAYHLLPAGAAFLFFADVVNCLNPGNLGRQGFAPTLSSAMGTNLDRLLFGLVAALRKEDFLGLVEKQKLAAVFFAELLRPTTEYPPPQKLYLFEMLQRFMLVFDLFGSFLLKACLQLTNTI
jgi:hypothetical protein